MTLKELNDKEEMNFSGFIRNLKTYKMERKVLEEREPQKKKSVALKATPCIPKEDEELDKEDEDEFAMAVRQVVRMFYKKEKMSKCRRTK